jgi:chromate transporter
MSSEGQAGTRITVDDAGSPGGGSSRDAQATAAGPLPISVLGLGRVFLEIGATSFGGLGPSLAIIEHELVDRRPLLTAADIAEAVAATRLLPGSSLVQVASYLGYRVRGWKGSAVATVACIFPPAVAMLVLAIGSEYVPSHQALGAAAHGVSAAVVGLLLATLCRFGRATIVGPVAIGFGLTAFVSAAVLRVPAAAIVVAAGLFGMLLLSKPQEKREPGSGRGGRS